jgi:hypothetical protein
MHASPAGQWHHAMFAAKFGHRHTAFGLTQDRDNLSLCVSACLHSKSPRSSCRENSTYAAPYFRGGLPTHESRQVLYPGDLGFEYVNAIQDREITWGRG